MNALSCLGLWVVVALIKILFCNADMLDFAKARARDILAN